MVEVNYVTFYAKRPNTKNGYQWLKMEVKPTDSYTVTHCLLLKRVHLRRFQTK